MSPMELSNLSDVVNPSPNGASNVLLALARAVEQRDGMIAGHCERLALTALAIGMKMGLDRESLTAIYRGGYLHDIGKVGVPDAILFKPGRLTPAEWVEMRRHAERGEEICRPLPELKPVLPIIRHHHERWDGSGYPDGLRSETIPLLARVVQVADIYDALTNPRPYKPAYTHQQAVRVMEEETARGWRDPEIVELFLQLHSEVIVRISEFGRFGDTGPEEMRASLANLTHVLDHAAAVHAPAC